MLLLPQKLNTNQTDSSGAQIPSASSSQVTVSRPKFVFQDTLLGAPGAQPQLSSRWSAATFDSLSTETHSIAIGRANLLTAVIDMLSVPPGLSSSGQPCFRKDRQVGLLGALSGGEGQLV